MRLPKVKSKAVLAALSISLICFGHAAGAAIILTGESRNIVADAFVDPPEGDSVEDFSSESTSGDFSDFDDVVEASVSLSDGSASATAQQTSQISTTSILASGEVTANAELTVPSGSTNYSHAHADATTNILVDFTLTTPYFFDLSGILSAPSDPGGYPFGDAVVRLTNGGLELSVSQPLFGNDEMTPFNLSGTLFPGHYRLDASAFIIADFYSDTFDLTSISGSSNFSLNMQFTPVPIPPPVLLFGSGLVALIGVARRKKAA